MKKAKTRTRAKATSPAPKKKTNEYRPKEVIKTNGAMDLDPGLLQMTSARAIAKSLKRSADSSKRLKGAPFHSAMSALNNLVEHVELQKARLEGAKKELRHLYGEDEDREHGEPNPPQKFARQKSAPKGKGSRFPEGQPVDNRQRAGRQTRTDRSES
jgi:Protein of unknown function (DUF3175)